MVSACDLMADPSIGWDAGGRGAARVQWLQHAVGAQSGGTSHGGGLPRWRRPAGGGDRLLRGQRRDAPRPLLRLPARAVTRVPEQPPSHLRLSQGMWVVSSRQILMLGIHCVILFPLLAFEFERSNWCILLLFPRTVMKLQLLVLLFVLV